LAGTVAIQIFFRYILNQPLFWPYEAALFFFVWLIWIGGATGMRDERQIRVDFFEQFFPEKFQKAVTIFNSLISILFMILVVYYGIKVTAIQANAEYDALPFRRDVLFVVAPLVGSLMIVYLAVVLVRQVRRMFGSPKKS
jgi:TRAP-type C4-dicarboxylate transport system permease small subunit